MAPLREASVDNLDDRSSASSRRCTPPEVSDATLLPSGVARSSCPELVVEEELPPADNRPPPVSTSPQQPRRHSFFIPRKLSLRIASALPTSEAKISRAQSLADERQIYELQMQRWLDMSVQDVDSRTAFDRTGRRSYVDLARFKAGEQVKTLDQARRQLSGHDASSGASPASALVPAASESAPAVSAEAGAWQGDDQGGGTGSKSSDEVAAMLRPVEARLRELSSDNSLVMAKVEQLERSLTSGLDELRQLLLPMKDRQAGSDSAAV